MSDEIPDHTILLAQRLWFSVMDDEPGAQEAIARALVETDARARREERERLARIFKLMPAVAAAIRALDDETETELRRELGDG